jgi:hypothetical protein
MMLELVMSILEFAATLQSKTEQVALTAMHAHQLMSAQQEHALADLLWSAMTARFAQ